MPTFWGRAVKVNACVIKFPASDDESLGENNGSSHYGHTLRSTISLAEKTYRDPDDEIGDLQFLGKHKDMPFFLVQANPQELEQPQTPPQEVSDDSVSHHSLTEAAGTGSEASGDGLGISLDAIKRISSLGADDDGTALSSTSRAFAICVSLSPKSITPFILNGQVGRTCDVQMLVYLNGELASSRTIQAYRRHGRPPRDELDQLVAGQRVAVDKEHAWVLRPLDAASHKRQIDERRDPELARRRWDAVSDQLRIEERLWKRDSRADGDSLMSDYLSSLADRDMPTNMEETMNENDHGASFAILDIVLVRGKTKQDLNCSLFLKEPTRYSNLQTDWPDADRRESLRRPVASLTTKLAYPQKVPRKRKRESHTNMFDNEDQPELEEARVVRRRLSHVDQATPAHEGIPQGQGPMSDTQEDLFRRIEESASREKTPCRSTRARSSFATSRDGESISLRTRTRDGEPAISTPLKFTSTTMAKTDSIGSLTSSLATDAERKSSFSTQDLNKNGSTADQASQSSDSAPSNLHEHCMIGYSDGITSDPLVDAAGFRSIKRVKGLPFEEEDILVGLRFVVG
ncbi:MAG: Meiotic recombination protein dmc1 [Chaenotheca gracillima]|nr:MAG: Meiotic recombination protein dmc1 [Chaenotheca gracillima]